MHVLLSTKSRAPLSALATPNPESWPLNPQPSILKLQVQERH
jgi:hypothetical protein